MQITIVTPGYTFTRGYLISWMKMIGEARERGWDVGFANNYSADIYVARNKALNPQNANVLKLSSNEEIHPLGGQPYDYLLWADSDVSWEPGDVAKLIEDDREIISGLIPLDPSGRSQVGWTKSPGWLRTEHLQREMYQGVIEVELMGMGFALFKEGVFETLGYPWFEPRMRELGNGVKVQLSEDISFSAKLREHGFELYADTDVRLVHDKMWPMRI